MNVKNILVGLFLIFVLLQILEAYLYNTLDAGYLEVTDVDFSGNVENLTLRIYLSNPYSVPLQFQEVSVKAKCGSGFYGASRGNVTVPPASHSVLQLEVGIPFGEEACNFTLVEYPMLLVTRLTGITFINKSKQFQLAIPGYGARFLWAGWNKTSVKLGECVDIEVHVKPPGPYRLTVLAELTGFAPEAVAQYEGLGDGVFTFCPKEPSSFKLKGYFLQVSAQDATWTQAPGYPPRLRVEP